MPTLPELGDFIREFGLPLAMLVAGVTLWLTGRVRSGRELQERTAELEQQLVYREALRVEERASRLAAEERLDRSLEADVAVMGLLKDIEREVLRGRTG